MDADYKISIDRSRALLRIEMSGFFTTKDVETFVAKRSVAYAEFKPSIPLSLVDIRGMKIQSQDVVDAFTAVLHDTNYRPRRLAFVVVRSLAWLQIQRAANGLSARYFTDYDEAMHWVLNGDPILQPNPLFTLSFKRNGVSRVD